VRIGTCGFGVWGLEFGVYSYLTTLEPISNIVTKQGLKKQQFSTNPNAEPKLPSYSHFPFLTYKNPKVIQPFAS
jgi:hypothetical protein